MFHRRPSRLRPLPRTVRATAFALLSLFVVGQLATSYHAMTVRHERCAEHGELVEARGSGEPATFALSGADALGADSHSDAEHAHDHCTLAPVRRGHASALAPLRGGLRLPAVTSFAFAEGGRVLIVQQALFRLAPKTSPPA